MKFPERRIDSWEEFAATIRQLDLWAGVGVRWLFRGQADAKHTLSPSLSRILQRYPVSRKEAELSEGAFMAEFAKRAHEHLPPAMIPRQSDPLGILVSMQHYGAPTRLLDWTESPYVAAYFAVEHSPEVDGAVWALKAPLFKTAGWVMPDPRNEPVLRPWLFGQPPRDIVGLVFPMIMTDRMAAQQTLFTVSPNIFADHAVLLEGLPDSVIKAEEAKGPVWLKMTIPAAQKFHFQRDLRPMNVTAQALFPGLDGLGRGVRDLAWPHFHYLNGLNL